MEQLLSDAISPADPNLIVVTAPGAGVVSVNLSGTPTEFIYQLPFPKKLYDPKAARVFLLEKADALENSVYEVFLDARSNSAGYIFPIRLLESRESDFVQNAKDSSFTPEQIDRFRNAALTTFCHLSRKVGIMGTSSNVEPISLSDIFGEDTIALMLTKDTSRVPEDFALFRYLPSLFQYGYLHKAERSPNFSSTPAGNKPPFNDCMSKTIRLRGISADYPNFDFVKDVFCETFPRYWSPITSFFLCYQFIEICIEEIRRKNGNQFVQDISSSILDNVKSENVIRDYQRNSNEKQRVKKLFSDHLLNSNVNGILIEGRALLSELGSPEASESESIYTLRNYYFHAYRLVREKCNDNIRLRTISWEVFLLTLEILTCFKADRNSSGSNSA